MVRWLSSLWVRLALGFALILAVALGSVSFYIAQAAEREATQFERQRSEAREARIRRYVSGPYARDRDRGGRDWAELQPALERTGPLFGRRIVVRDQDGNIVADSHRKRAPRRKRGDYDGNPSPILSGSEQIGSVEVAPADNGSVILDPPIAHLTSAINNYLLWTGIAAGLGGLLLVSLVLRRALAPLQTLGAAASRLGRGDLSQRVEVTGAAEIRELARSFNRMADGLQEAERQRRNMMADVAHELRTPLFNVQGYLEAVKDGLLEPDAETIGAIHGQALHLGRLVEDLRLLAQAEGGALRLEMELDSLDSLVAGLVDAARPRAEANGVELRFETPEQPVLAVMDRTRIAQVVTNLLDNAVRHTPAGGQVRARVAITPPDRARVSVEDDGEGIPTEDIPMIFERFYRVDPSRSRATGGAGLGLTIARRLVEAHGGSIRAENVPGGGTAVSFELPAATG